MILDPRYKAMENPTILLMHAIGWQGGTVHQVAEYTGLSVPDILSLQKHEPYSGLNSPDGAGWSCIRTCSLEWNRERIFPKYHGNIDFWAGVLQAQFSIEVMGLA